MIRIRIGGGGAGSALATLDKAQRPIRSLAQPQYTRIGINSKPRAWDGLVVGVPCCACALLCVPGITFAMRTPQALHPSF